MTKRWWSTGRALACLFAGVLGGCAGDDAVEGSGGALGPVADGGNGNASDAAALPGYDDAGLPPLGAQDAQAPSMVVSLPDGGQGCGSVKQRSEPVKPAVDVVWILDGSGSMGPHALAVGDNMLRFMENVRASGADINVVMLTGLIFGPVLQAAISDANYHWVYAEVQSHDAFPQALDAYDGYKQFLRPGAPTHFIVVTDDTSDMPASAFVPMMMAKRGAPFYFHAVAADGGLLGGGNCNGSGPGTEYFSAADATKGDKISLCADWAKNFEMLQGSVIASAPLPCEYPVPPPPNGQALDPGAVQVLFSPASGGAQEFAKATSMAQCGDFVGWYFDDNKAPKKVQMCPKACELVKQGGGIDLGFGCAPSIVLQ